MNEKLRITKQQSHWFWCPHFLKALHNLGGAAKFGEIFREILNMFDVDDAVREEATSTTKSNVLRNRIHQARGHLKDAGYIENPEFGVLALNAKAKAEIPKMLETLEEWKKNNDARGYAEAVVKHWKNERADKKQSGAKTGKKLQQAEDNFIAEEEKLLQEELGVVRTMESRSFERLCREIFKRLKYSDVENTRQTKDGGFDGFGYLVFGLARFKVAFEAKRYTPPSKVTEKDIKAFESTMRQVNAQKGVFITTSFFTRDAENFAEENGNITLVNGEKLIDLLREHKIGYSLRLMIDKEFFKNF